jgi:hydroxyacylglutathione hydrolase
VRVGLDRIAGWIEPAALDAYRVEGGRLDRAPEVDVAEAARLREAGAFALDVRRATEFEEGHVGGALNIAHTRLVERVGEVPAGGPVLVNCLGGGRSARACAFLRRRGYDAVNVGGGFKAWEMAGLPVDTER